MWNHNTGYRIYIAGSARRNNRGDKECSMTQLVSPIYICAPDISISEGYGCDGIRIFCHVMAGWMIKLYQYYLDLVQHIPKRLYPKRDKVVVLQYRFNSIRICTKSCEQAGSYSVGS